MNEIVQAITAVANAAAGYFKVRSKLVAYEHISKVDKDIDNLRQKIARLRSTGKLEDKYRAEDLTVLYEHRVAYKNEI